MSRFQVSQVDGVGGGGDVGGGDGVISDAPNGGSNENGGIGIENPAMDPAELNVYGLYTKRNSVSCPPQGELKRKSSYGFTHLTR